MGKNKDAGSQAASAANKATQQGIDMITPFVEAGSSQLEGLASGATVSGLDERLGEIFNSDTFQSLIGDRERGVQSQLAAGGLTRSGAGLESIANVGSELGLQLENLLTGRSQSLAGQGLNAGNSVASMFTKQGENTSSGILSDAQASAAFGSELIGVGSSIFFSDERLKENIVELGQIGDLGLCEWDWKEFTEGTIINDCPTVGFIAQEVQEKYPEFVAEESGWLFVDYGSLMRRLQSNLDAKIVEDEKCLH